MGLKQTTAPTSEPLTIAEVRTHLSIDGTDHDAELTILLAAARSHVETRTLRQLMVATYTLTMSRWPAGGVIELPRPPARAVSSITYYDENEASQTFATSKYHVDISSEPGRVVLDDGEDWPTIDVRPEAITVVYTAGYDDAASVPGAAKVATLQLVGHWFENREAVAFGGQHATLPMAVNALVNQIKVPDVN